MISSIPPLSLIVPDGQVVRERRRSVLFRSVELLFLVVRAGHTDVLLVESFGDLGFDGRGSPQRDCLNEGGCHVVLLYSGYTLGVLMKMRWV